MNYSILIVDDEPHNFETIEALLTNTGYDLHYAHRGEEAIAGLDKFDPDAILLDVMMPGIDGIEVCRRIKAMPQWQAVPIIMVTALAETTDLARCLAAGADDFVSKPINGVELRARVQSMLRIKKQHDRIQSLSKLQRNNIHSLENSLHELHLDLAVSFPDEVNAPLHSMLANIERLRRNFKQMAACEIDEMLASIDRSALQLDTLNQSFLFYLQLALPLKSSRKRETCASKISTEFFIKRQISQMQTAPRLFLNIENAELAVSEQHLQYIVGELLNCTLKVSTSATFINVYGHVMDNIFHFYIDNRAVSPVIEPNSKLSELIQFNSGLDDAQELGIGLKIVKKIIEIYDGIFLMANTDVGANGEHAQAETTIYITLPLAGAMSSQQFLTNLMVN
jgi:two-component system, sensor histidine kinase and response regulator